MKKSPLSTPGGHSGNFFRGRGRKRGYGYNNMRNDGDNSLQFSSPTDPTRFGGDMIPLDSSSPNYQNSRRDWRQNNKRDQRFSNTGISGSSNWRSSAHNGSGSPYSPQQHQKNYQHQDNFRQKYDPAWHRKIPISEFVDIKDMIEDPWAELEQKLEERIRLETQTTRKNDSSVEIILERNKFQDSASQSDSDGNTINISSFDEPKSQEDSSVDIQLECINFNQSSQEISILSDSSISQNNKSLSSDEIPSQADSVIEISL